MDGLTGVPDFQSGYLFERTLLLCIYGSGRNDVGRKVEDSGAGSVLKGGPKAALTRQEKLEDPKRMRGESFILVLDQE